MMFHAGKNFTKDDKNDNDDNNNTRSEKKIQYLHTTICLECLHVSNNRRNG